MIEDKIPPMVVDGVSVDLFAGTNAFSQVSDGDDMPDEEGRKDPDFIDGNELVSRLGSMVATAFDVATMTAVCMLKV